MVLTPTSYGLQPYQFLVIIAPANAPNFSPIPGTKDRWWLFALRRLHRKGRNDRGRRGKLIQRIVEIRKLPTESLNAYRGMMLGDVVNGPRGKIAHEWATRQTYNALGNLMTCAAVLEVNACPMEGLNPPEYDGVLNLNGSGYATVVACALGYHSPDDKYAKLTKVRFEPNDFVRHI